MPVLAYEGLGFDPERVSELMGKYSVTNAFIPPTALKMLRSVSNIKERYQIKLRAVMSAGEQVGSSAANGRNQRRRSSLFNLYLGNHGATERRTGGPPRGDR